MPPSKTKPLGAADVKLRISTLIRVVQDKNKCRNFVPGESWWLLKHNSKMQKRFPNGVTLFEQIGCDQGSFVSAYGRAGVQSFHNGFIHLEEFSSCCVATILGANQLGRPIPINGGAPETSKIVSSVSMGTAVSHLRCTVLDSLNVPPPVHSTPTPRLNVNKKRPPPAITPTGDSEADNSINRKRLRKDGEFKNTTLHQDLSGSIEELLEKHKASLELLATAVLDKILDEA